MTIGNTGTAVKRFEYGIHSRTIRKLKIQYHLGSNRLLNENTIPGTMYRESRLQKAGRNVHQRSIQVAQNTQNNSIKLWTPVCI